MILFKYIQSFLFFLKGCFEVYWSNFWLRVRYNPHPTNKCFNDVKAVHLLCAIHKETERVP